MGIETRKEIDWPIIPLQTMGKMRCEINERKSTGIWTFFKRNGNAKHWRVYRVGTHYGTVH